MTAGTASILAGANIDWNEVPETKGTGRLPPDAAGLFRDLTADAEDASDAAGAAQRRFLEARQDVHILRGQLQDLEQRHPQNAMGDRYLKGLRTQIAAGAERAKGLGARSDEMAARAGALIALANRLRTFLDHSAGDLLIPYTGALPKFGKNETPVQAVERCRAKVVELRREIQTTGNAPLTSAEAKAAAREFVKAAAYRARPDVSTLFAGHPDPHFPHIPEMFVHPVAHGGHTVVQGGQVRDGFSLACWLHEDEVIAALDREIDARARDDKAMTAGQKAERLVALAAELLAVERDEEAFLRMAVAQDLPVERRPDADPRAVLQIDVAEPVPLEESAGATDPDEVVIVGSRRSRVAD
jgi:hypothetical protein